MLTNHLELLYQLHQVEADLEYANSMSYYRRDLPYLRSWLSYLKGFIIKDSTWMSILVELINDPDEADDGARAFVESILLIQKALPDQGKVNSTWHLSHEVEKIYGWPEKSVSCFVNKQSRHLPPGSFLKVGRNLYISPACINAIVEHRNDFKNKKRYHFKHIHLPKV